MKPKTPPLERYALNDAAERFLSEFDGLRVLLPGRLPFFGFVGGWAYLGWGMAPAYDALLPFEQLLGPFFPIGHKDDCETLVMTPDAGVFIVSNEILTPDGNHFPVCLLGESGDEALERLVNRSPLKEMPSVPRYESG